MAAPVRAESTDCDVSSGMACATALLCRQIQRRVADGAGKGGGLRTSRRVEYATRPELVIPMIRYLLTHAPLSCVYGLDGRAGRGGTVCGGLGRTGSS